jgi:nitroimidazol reductase NimA-like FMN-containing flavoprotein (pyridoxamine 5'-phosphate oxidase superfamily)
VAEDLMVVLSEEECRRLLARVHFGRIGFVAEGEPTVLPVNYAFDGAAIVFRSTHGSKLAAAIAGRRVAFQVDATDPLYQGGWSVLVRGAAEVVDDPAEVERLARLPLRPWWPRARDRWLRIPVERITGRRLRGQ